MLRRVVKCSLLDSSWGDMMKWFVLGLCALLLVGTALATVELVYLPEGCTAGEEGCDAYYYDPIGCTPGEPGCELVQYESPCPEGEPGCD